MSANGATTVSNRGIRCQLMLVNIILFGVVLKLSKPSKDKSRFHVSKIPYKTQNIERNKSNSSII